MIAVQLAAFLSMDSALTRNTRRRVGTDLERGGDVFLRLLGSRTEQLQTAARLLAGDYAFKNAYFTAIRYDPKTQHDTLQTVLANYQARIGSEVMMLITTDRIVIADTLHPRRMNVPTKFGGLIDLAEQDDSAGTGGGAAAIVFIDGRAYQMVVVPLKAPKTAAWICSGFILDDRAAKSIQKSVTADVTFMRTRKHEWRVLASTFGADMKRTLETELPRAHWQSRKSLSINMGRDEYISVVLPLSSRGDYQLHVALQRSLKRELAPFHTLRQTLLVLFIVSMGGAVLGAVWISRTVTRPVHTLVDGARRIARGEFGQTMEIKQQDEIGELADAFNDMTRGLAERDSIRNLLGKVVSPEIADELLAKGVELGGQIIRVTILFTDIRSFTTLSEQLSPHEVIELLNAFLTDMSDVIERNGGVVDKYVGDEIMALFGAPISHADDADRAMRAALEMRHALVDLNRKLTERIFPKIEIGIGINTADVVAGNVGSNTRLNYTVIGDGVNLAARLETLTKTPEYNTHIIMSEATLRAARGKYKTRFLDEVAVKGKTLPTRIYALEDSEESKTG